jgi:hypothetical protein
VIPLTSVLVPAEFINRIALAVAAAVPTVRLLDPALVMVQGVPVGQVTETEVGTIVEGAPFPDGILPRATVGELMVQFATLVPDTVMLPVDVAAEANPEPATKAATKPAKTNFLFMKKLLIKKSPTKCRQY